MDEWQNRKSCGTPCEQDDVYRTHHKPGTTKTTFGSKVLIAMPIKEPCQWPLLCYTLT